MVGTVQARPWPIIGARTAPEQLKGATEALEPVSAGEATVGILVLELQHGSTVTLSMDGACAVGLDGRRLKAGFSAGRRDYCAKACASMLSKAAVTLRSVIEMC